jgi:hypothetical protein
MDNIFDRNAYSKLYYLDIRLSCTVSYNVIVQIRCCSPSPWEQIGSKALNKIQGDLR